MSAIFNRPVSAAAAVLLLSGPRAAASDDVPRAQMTFPRAEWVQTKPEAQGLDPAKLEAAVDYLKRHAPQDGVDELLIVRNGQVVWAGPGIDRKHGIWSCTKSFTSTVLGLLVEDGRCTLDTPMAQVLPDMSDTYPGVTLRHLATMTSGYRAEGDETDGSYTHGPSPTPFRPSPQPLFTPPGSRYAYWDSAMNQLAHALTQIAGKPLELVFERRVGDPIGMDPEEWDWGAFESTDGLAVNGGAGNNDKHVRISARTMARLGHLLLNRGRWDGEQLIAPSWIDEATRVQVPADLPLANPELSPADGRGCYGYNWWRNGTRSGGERKWPGAPPSTFAASGYNNNDMFVIPEWGMVVVRLGLDEGSGFKVPDETHARFLEMLGQALEGMRSGAPE